jgi:hypothetical protein
VHVFLKAMSELIGGEVRGHDGHIGAIDDLYVDGACWQVRYLLIDTGKDGGDEQVLVSPGCVEIHRHGAVRLMLSSMQFETGAGVWPAQSASRWLDRERLCSGSDLVGFRVEAADGAAGRVADLLLDEQEWCIDYLVIDAADARGVHQVLLPLDWVGGIDVRSRSVSVDRTRAELRSSPRLDGM